MMGNQVQCMGLHINSRERLMTVILRTMNPEEFVPYEDADINNHYAEN